MAHFAELDNNNKVLRVVVVDDNEVGENGSLQGEQYCQNLFGGNWKQTSYSTKEGVHYTFSGEAPDRTTTVSTDQTKAFRKNFASIGWNYDPIGDGFYPDKDTTIGMDDSWTLNPTTFMWDPPVPYPAYPGIYTEENGEEKNLYPFVWNTVNWRWESTVNAILHSGDSRKFYWDTNNLNWVLIN